MGIDWYEAELKAKARTELKRSNGSSVYVEVEPAQSGEADREYLARLSTAASLVQQFDAPVIIHVYDSHGKDMLEVYGVPTSNIAVLSNSSVGTMVDVFYSGDARELVSICRADRALRRMMSFIDKVCYPTMFTVNTGDMDYNYAEEIEYVRM